MNPFGFWSVIIRTGFLFVICVHVSRASLARILASIEGGVVFMLGSILWDVLAGRKGWWVYPAMGVEVMVLSFGMRAQDSASPG